MEIMACVLHVCRLQIEDSYKFYLGFKCIVRLFLDEINVSGTSKKKSAVMGSRLQSPHLLNRLDGKKECTNFNGFSKVYSFECTLGTLKNWKLLSFQDGLHCRAVKDLVEQPRWEAQRARPAFRATRRPSVMP